MFVEMNMFDNATLEFLAIDAGMTVEEAEAKANELGVDVFDMLNPYKDLKGVDAYLNAVFKKPADVYLIREAYMQNFIKMCEEKEKELDTNFFIPVNNIPDYARGKRYVVARYENGEFWFWGAWDDRKKADEVAYQINGKVFDTKNE